MRIREMGTRMQACAPVCVGVAQRAIDILVSGAGLLLLAPLMFLVALAVWCDGGRPVLFAQERLGAGGRPFRLYKFRKFRPDEPGGGAAVTVANDCRLTRMGNLLARTKLDELPQLWNVLAGDMSIVGPRPEALAFADCFDGSFRAVLAYRPGIFGPNQVFFRDEASLYDVRADPEEFYRRVLFPLKARADLAYFPNRTITGDLAWIVRGALAVLGIRRASRRGVGAVQQAEAWIRRSSADATTVLG